MQLPTLSLHVATGQALSECVSRMPSLHSLVGGSLQETHQHYWCTRMITQGNHALHDHYFMGGRLMLKPKGDKASFLAKPTSLGLLGRPILNSQQQGPLRPYQGQGLTMAHSKQPLNYLEFIQGWAPAMQKESFSLTVYSMGLEPLKRVLELKESSSTPGQETSSYRIRSASQQCGSDGSHHIHSKEENPHHGCERLQGCRSCPQGLLPHWHTQQKCEHVCFGPCHGQMGLAAGGPFAGRCQGHLPQWCTQLSGHCHDLHRWTPPVSHVRRAGTQDGIYARHRLLRSPLVSEHMGTHLQHMRALFMEQCSQVRFGQAA